MITVENICFSYGKKSILNNISFTLEPGTINCLVGSNGCGKSTLLSIITGIQKPATGSVHFANLAKCSYVPQDNPLLSDATAYDNLFLWFKGTKADFKEALNSPDIEMLGIKDFLKKPVKKLSGGMKKRLSIAIAIINKPSILVLDEPSAALDLPCKLDIRNFLSRFAANGGTVLLTTHDENEINLCQRLFTIKNGQLAELDPSLRGQALTSQF